MRHRSDSAADAGSLERLGLCIAGLKQPSAGHRETTAAVAKRKLALCVSDEQSDRHVSVGVSRPCGTRLAFSTDADSARSRSGLGEGGMLVATTKQVCRDSSSP